MRMGVHEERTRIILHLPNKNPAEASAIFSVVGHLRQLRNVLPRKRRITGYTHAQIFPPVYEGSWWNGRRWVEDPLVVIMVDHQLKIRTQDLIDELDSLKSTVAQFYAHEQSPQKEIWVVVHPVWRYD